MSGAARGRGAPRRRGPRGAVGRLSRTEPKRCPPPEAPSMLDQTIARRLKLVGFDVDGVLTDNGVYLGVVGDHPVEFKRFHIQDGLGIRLLRSAGLVVVWLTGRGSTPTALRGRELSVGELIQDPTARKLPAVAGLLDRR